MNIPNALENTALLAALTHPNHIVCRGSLGFTRLPPPRDSNYFGYIHHTTQGYIPFVLENRALRDFKYFEWQVALLCWKVWIMNASHFLQHSHHLTAITKLIVIPYIQYTAITLRNGRFRINDCRMARTHKVT